MKCGSLDKCVCIFVHADVCVCVHVHVHMWACTVYTCVGKNKETELTAVQKQEAHSELRGNPQMGVREDGGGGGWGLWVCLAWVVMPGDSGEQQHLENAGFISEELNLSPT